MQTSTQPLPKIRASVIYGWLSWLLVFAIRMLVDNGSTAPFNRPTAFVLFSGFYSVFYILDYLILVPVVYLVLTRVWPTARAWHWAALGAALFAVSAPLWEAAFEHNVLSDKIFGSVLGAIAGAAACYMLRRSNS